MLYQLEHGINANIHWAVQFLQSMLMSKPESKSFKVPNTENIVEKGKKAPLKNQTIILHKICEGLQTDIYTASGLPSVSVDALKSICWRHPQQ